MYAQDTGYLAISHKLDGIHKEFLKGFGELKKNLENFNIKTTGIAIDDALKPKQAKPTLDHKEGKITE